MTGNLKDYSRNLHGSSWKIGSSDCMYHIGIQNPCHRQETPDALYYKYLTLEWFQESLVEMSHGTGPGNNLVWISGHQLNNGASSGEDV